MPKNRLAIQLQLSALKAATSSGIAFLTGVIVIPVVMGMDRIFYGNWNIFDWRLSLEVTGILSGIWFAFLFLSSLLELRGSDARSADRPIRTFPALVYIRLILLFVYGLSACLFWGTRQEHDPVSLQCVALSFSLLSFFGWPAKITLSERGISQRTRFGRLRTIPYSDVQYLTYLPSDGTTIVEGSQYTIRHTSSHADTTYFQQLIKKRTGKKIY